MGRAAVTAKIQQADQSPTAEPWWRCGVASCSRLDVICPDGVSERSKPASRERMKTSHFEGGIALSAIGVAQGRDESTQCELATFDNDLGGAWLVAPADCAGTEYPPGDGGAAFTIGRFKTGQSAHRLSV